jgi:hypothetical protein
MRSQTYPETKYLPARLDVSFSHANLDWIKVTLVATGGGAKVTVYDDNDEVIESTFEEDAPSEATFFFSSVFCPFESFMAWLEAGTTLVESCAFTFDAEGPIGRLEFSSCDLMLIYPMKFEPEEEPAFKCTVDRMQAVGAFYSAFRRFVMSDEYEPRRYEARHHWMGTTTNSDDRDITALFRGDYDKEELEPSEEEYFPEAWGANLRELRSPMVEKAVGWGD